jgi:CO dehydrogenase/acetyl-CoA synthase alpha subunit
MSRQFPRDNSHDDDWSDFDACALAAGMSDTIALEMQDSAG